VFDGFCRVHAGSTFQGLRYPPYHLV
jgi:hypothetical protein